MFLPWLAKASNQVPGFDGASLHQCITGQVREMYKQKAWLANCE
jgi:hypothetical protein